MDRWIENLTWTKTSSHGDIPEYCGTNILELGLIEIGYVVFEVSSFVGNP